MENNKFGLGVFTCVFNTDYSKILLLFRNSEKRKRWGADWGNVGGVVEFGETTLQACIREIMEEIGVKMNKSNLKLIYVKETLKFMPHLQAVHFVYAASIDENTKILLNAKSSTVESERYEWFSVSNLPKKMFDSEDEIVMWRNLAKSNFKIAQNNE